jgi:prevent-host-death family protein
LYNKSNKKKRRRYYEYGFSRFYREIDSCFSQGKAGKIFNDVAENDTEYIVLKNNQPTAVVLSLKAYRETQEKIEKSERLLEKIENIRLLNIAEKRAGAHTTSFESFVEEEGFSMEELKKLAESVEFE